MFGSFFQETSGNGIGSQECKEVEQISSCGIRLLNGLKGDLPGGGDAVRIVFRLALESRSFLSCP